MKKINYKKILRNSNQAPVDRAFLDNFRAELNNFVLVRPIERTGLFLFMTKTATILALLIFVVLGGGSLVYASHGSLPGQLLYPVKINSEKILLTLAVNPEARKKLQSKFINERIKEVEIISREKNINKNAGQALQIIDEQIKRLENAQNNKSDRTESIDSPDSNSPSQNNTASSTTIDQEHNQDQAAKKSHEGSQENNREKLLKSQRILEKLINTDEKAHNDENNNSDGNNSRNGEDQINKQPTETPYTISNDIVTKEKSNPEAIPKTPDPAQ